MQEGDDGTEHDWLCIWTAVAGLRTNDRQNALAAAGLTQAQAKAADIQFHQSVLTSAMANSVSPSSALMALRSLGASPPALPSVVPHLEAEQLPVEPEPPEKPEPVATTAKHAASKPAHR